MNEKSEKPKELVTLVFNRGSLVKPLDKNALIVRRVDEDFASMIMAAHVAKVFRRLDIEAYGFSINGEQALTALTPMGTKFQFGEGCAEQLLRLNTPCMHMPAGEFDIEGLKRRAHNSGLILV